MFYVYNPQTAEQAQINKDLLAMMSIPWPSQSVLLDIYTANFGTDFEPQPHGESSPKELGNDSPITSLPSSTRMDGRFAKERTDAVRQVGEAKEKSKSDIPCGSYFYGKRYYCRKRICPICSACRHYHMRTNLVRRIQPLERQRIYSLTFTMPAATTQLPTLLNILTNGLKELRRRKAWSAVAGGAWFLDLTYNSIAQQWHPHLHMVAETTDIGNIENLQFGWLKLTGGSVYHSHLTDTEDDIKKLCDYHTTPPHLKDASKNDTFVSTPDLHREYAMAIKGKRLFGTFGSWKEFKLLARDTGV